MAPLRTSAGVAGGVAFAAAPALIAATIVLSVLPTIFQKELRVPAIGDASAVPQQVSGVAGGAVAKVRALPAGVRTVAALLPPRRDVGGGRAGVDAGGDVQERVVAVVAGEAGLGVAAGARSARGVTLVAESLGNDYFRKNKLRERRRRRNSNFTLLSA